MKSDFAKEKTYERLKAYLLSGRIGPGERIHQEMCAEIMNVSRTPVREALQRLASEGLVERGNERGFRIVQLSVDELEELFDVRAALEAFSMRLICQKITPESIDQLSRYVDEADAALDRQNADGVFEANTAFHNTLYSIIKDRKRFLSILNTMKEHILRYRKQTLTHADRARRSIDSHKKILFALKTKDPNLAQYLMMTHIQESMEDALESNFGVRGTGNAAQVGRLMCPQPL